MICFLLYFVLCGLEFDPRPWLFSLFFRVLFIFLLSYFLDPSRNTTRKKQYRQALNKPTPLHLQQKQRSFLTFGFGASGGGTGVIGDRSSLAVAGGMGGGPPRRESNINVNVTPTSHDALSDTPEIRKYKKRFNSEVLCASLWGKIRCY